MVTALLETGEAQVIEDAQTDDRVNKEIVRELGNRTVINIPMMLIDVPFGSLGAGTFGDEGVRLPTDEELAYLHELANIIVLASARILLAREREAAIRKQAETDRLLADRQRIESLGELAGGVAHDFNNMLTVILGAAQVLRSELKDPEQFANLRMIENAAESASDLAKQLLALGKRQELAAEPTDVVHRVRSIGEMLGRVLGGSIVVEIATEPDLPEGLRRPPPARTGPDEPRAQRARRDARRRHARRSASRPTRSTTSTSRSTLGHGPASTSGSPSQTTASASTRTRWRTSSTRFSRPERTPAGPVWDSL